MSHERELLKPSVELTDDYRARLRQLAAAVKLTANEQLMNQFALAMYSSWNREPESRIEKEALGELTSSWMSVVRIVASKVDGDSEEGESSSWYYKALNTGMSTTKDIDSLTECFSFTEDELEKIKSYRSKLEDAGEAMQRAVSDFAKNQSYAWDKQAEITVDKLDIFSRYTKSSISYSKLTVLLNHVAEASRIKASPIYLTLMGLSHQELGERTRPTRMSEVKGWFGRFLNYFSKKKDKTPSLEQESNCTELANNLLLDLLTDYKNAIEDKKKDRSIWGGVKKVFGIISALFIFAAGGFEVLDGIATVFGMLTIGPVLLISIIGGLFVLGMVAFASFELTQYFSELGVSFSFNPYDTERYKKIKALDDLMISILEYGAVDGDERFTHIKKKFYKALSEQADIVTQNLFKNLYLSNMRNGTGSKEIQCQKELYPYFEFTVLDEEESRTNVTHTLASLSLEDQATFKAEGSRFTVCYQGKIRNVTFNHDAFFEDAQIRKPWFKKHLLKGRGLKIISGVMTFIVSFIEGSGGYFLGFGLLAALGIGAAPIWPIALGIIGGIGFGVMGLIINYNTIQRFFKHFSKDKVDIISSFEKQNSRLNGLRENYSMLSSYKRIFKMNAQLMDENKQLKSQQPPVDEVSQEECLSDDEPTMAEVRQEVSEKDVVEQFDSFLKEPPPPSMRPVSYRPTDWVNLGESSEQHTSWYSMLDRSGYQDDSMDLLTRSDPGSGSSGIELVKPKEASSKPRHKRSHSSGPSVWGQSTPEQESLSRKVLERNWRDSYSPFETQEILAPKGL